MGKKISHDSSLGFVLFSSWVGALVYFVQNSDGFIGFFVAIFKSIFWPAFVVFETLTRLGL